MLRVSHALHQAESWLVGRISVIYNRLPTGHRVLAGRSTLELYARCLLHFTWSSSSSSLSDSCSKMHCRLSFSQLTTKRDVNIQITTLVPCLHLIAVSLPGVSHVLLVARWLFGGCSGLFCYSWPVSGSSLCQLMTSLMN